MIKSSEINNNATNALQPNSQGAAANAISLAATDNVDDLNSDDDVVHAEEIIALLFYNPHSNSNPELSVTIPEFTHQLFDDDVVDTLENPYEHRLIFRVNCKDLTHTIYFNKDFTKQDIEQTLKKLQKTTPEGTSHFRLSKWDEYDITKEVKRMIVKHRGQSAIDSNGATISESSKTNISSNKNDEGGASTTSIAVPTTPIEPSYRHHLCGRSIDTFERDGFTYDLRLASNSDKLAVELLERFERLAVWFIETADPVDFANDDRWEVVFLFRKPSSPSSSGVEDWVAVGYMTLFSFRNPARGAIIRVCQALILPFAQRLGLGQKMLGSIYEKVVAARPEVSEVNVEDPADGFKKMRDRVDVIWGMKYLLDNSTIDIDAVDAEYLSNVLKINLAQSQFVKEAIQFHRLNCQLMSSNTDMSSVDYDKNELLLRFRLDVKKRLLSKLYTRQVIIAARSREYSSSSTLSSPTLVSRNEIVAELSKKFKELTARYSCIPYNSILTALQNGDTF